MGKIVQNIFTVTKTISLAGLVLLGVFFSTVSRARARISPISGGTPAALTMHPYPPDNPTWMIGTLTLVGVAMVGSLFAMDAWNNITFTAAEVKNPSRNLPLSLALGHRIIVILLYTLANVAYLRVLPLSGDPQRRNGARARNRIRRRRPRGARPLLEVIFGPAGAIVMAVAILISTFGCNNGLILVRRADLLRDGEGSAFFSIRGHSEPPPRAGRRAGRSMRSGRRCYAFRAPTASCSIF